MELTQLKYFQMVARTQSLARAALELNISQPTLSQSIRRLESSVGYPLFDHTPGKKLQLNPAGVMFLEKIDRALTEINQGVRQVREYSSISRAQVFFGTAVQELCTEIVLSYYKKAPNARISQKLVEINSLPTLLVKEVIDFSVSPCPLSEYDPRIESIPLYVEEFFAIVGEKHPFFGRKYVHVEEIIGQRYICNFSESDLQFIYKFCKPEYEEELDVMLQSNEPLVIRRILDEGTGVAFMPSRVVMRRMETGDPVMQNPIRIVGFDQTTPTCISRKKGRIMSAAAAELYQHVIDYCKNEAELQKYFIQTYFGK